MTLHNKAYKGGCMIKSMTGYAEAVYTTEDLTIKGVFRACNSRYLDLVFYFPDSLRMFEEKIKKIVASKLVRGRVEIRIFLDEISEKSLAFSADLKRAEAYYNALNVLKKQLNIKEKITLEQVLAGKNMIIPKEPDHDENALFEGLSLVVHQCLDNLDKMRINEGNNLLRDIEERFTSMEIIIDLIAKQAEGLPVLYKRKLEARLKDLMLENNDFDPVRIAQEIAIIADKSDISEEIVRAKSHINQAREILFSQDIDTSPGRKLNFLVQEFNREYNTMGSKSGDVKISKMVVDLKSELEKIREQVQNIE